MDQTRIERSIWIDAPRERVWQAVTEPAQIGRWMLPPALGAELARAADGALVVSMGGMEIPLATLDVIEPARQAVSYGLPDRLIATTDRLDDQDGGTEVSVTMTGFEKLPAETRREYMTPSAAAWEKGLLNLQAAVAGAELPHSHQPGILKHREVFEDALPRDREQSGQLGRRPGAVLGQGFQQPAPHRVGQRRENGLALGIA